MAKILVSYPGAFMLTLGCHRFEVYIGETLVFAARGYRRCFETVVDLRPGSHRLEIRAINKLTGWRRSSFFNFEIPDDGAYRLRLHISRAWGSWRQPLLEAVERLPAVRGARKALRHAVD